MTHLSELVQFLDQNLSSDGYEDSSQNGLQVESSCTNINKIGLAVDSGLSVIEEAIKKGCELLIVHHGLFWGVPEKISGITGKKVRALIEGGCSLYASHLPLDGHPVLGNNAQIMNILGIGELQTYCRCGSRDIGYVGTLTQEEDTAQFEIKLQKIISNERFLGLKFGPSKVKKIAVLSGGGAFALEEAAALGADTFISGEPKQSVFHQAKELGINAFFAGHYATETFGVKAVGKELQDKFGVMTEFIDQPTSI